jgi:hypothetical protein
MRATASLPHFLSSSSSSVTDEVLSEGFSLEELLIGSSGFEEEITGLGLELEEADAEVEVEAELEEGREEEFPPP